MITSFLTFPLLSISRRCDDQKEFNVLWFDRRRVGPIPVLRDRRLAQCAASSRPVASCLGGPVGIIEQKPGPIPPPRSLSAWSNGLRPELRQDHPAMAPPRPPRTRQPDRRVATRRAKRRLSNAPPLLHAHTGLLLDGQSLAFCPLA